MPKNSDVWVKAAYCGEDRIGLPVYEPFDVRNVIPHSKALRSVAELLAEVEAGPWALLINAIGHARELNDSAIFNDPLKRLHEALQASDE